MKNFCRSNRKTNYIKSNKDHFILGYSLVELLITTSIGLGIVLGISSIFLQQHKEIRRLEVKSEILDFRSELKMHLASSAVCRFNFQNKSFNIPVNNSTSVTPNNSGIVYLGSSTNSPKLQVGQFHPKIRGLEIDGVTLKNFRQPDATGEPNKWLADFVIDLKFNQTQLSPISVLMALNTTGTDSLTINDCATFGEPETPTSVYSFVPGTNKFCVMASLMQVQTYIGPGAGPGYVRIEMLVDSNGVVKHRYCNSNATPCSTIWLWGLSAFRSVWDGNGESPTDIDLFSQVDNVGGSVNNLRCSWQ